MRGSSTGRDPSPSAPESAGKAPMNTSETPESIGPESVPKQSTADATEIQQSPPGAPSQPALSSTASAAIASETADGADAPKKHHLLIPIPSRRSSKTDKQCSTERAEDAAQEPPSRRGSRVSILKVRRERSRASSRRSRRTQTQSQDMATVNKSPETTTPTTPEMDSSKPPQKKSKLLALLSCCSSADVDGDDSTLPPKKTTKREPAANRLPTPDKAEANTGDSSTAESRDPADLEPEKPSQTVSADQPQSRGEEPGIQAPTEGQAQETSAGVSHPEIPPVGPKEHDEQVPAVVGAGAANGSIPEAKIAAAQRPDVQAAATETTLPIDLTPKQPSTIETEDHAHEEEITQTPIVLPPPPPPPPVPGVPSVSEEGEQQWLLPPVIPHLQGRKCLVLDLDETLVHSSFKVLERADFTIPVEIEGQYHNIYVIKRPGVDQFMKRVGELYEVVVFTASVSKYGDPLLDQLDIHNVVHHRLFRESCFNHHGNYVKDLAQIGRDLRETIIIDNSPTSYIFHPHHAIPISSWFSDAHDNELLDLIPVLEDLAGAQVQDVSMVLDIGL
ncbi:uncharacterized protein N7459_002566 [Penicillium hispanicum]|uniref:uncharacterized protein n=1 Tax=Penicillium hispanicum TaxID=1080232 RepID=UPI002541F2ED|nr:uncharacterized protein N7459_002566 [Penicillium hispanicum]KAJ5586801.1 hypothetical protein N7459_002566 [Penicillium hispanicum]